MLTRGQIKKKREESAIVGSTIINGTVADNTPIANHPKTKKKKITAKPIPSNCREFKPSGVYPKYKKNIDPKDKEKNEKMYNHVKDYISNFPLPQALMDENVSCTKFEEANKVDPLGLFREYTTFTIKVSAFVRFTHIGQSIQNGDKQKAHGYGLQMFKNNKDHLLIYHGLFNNGYFIQGQRLSKGIHNNLLIEEGYFQDHKILTKGVRIESNIYSWDEKENKRQIYETNLFKDIQEYHENQCLQDCEFDKHQVTKNIVAQTFYNEVEGSDCFYIEKIKSSVDDLETKTQICSAGELIAEII